MKIGVISTSLKRNEQRVAIHPLHVDWVSAKVRNQLFYETGYGARFGVPDKQISPFCGGFMDRGALIAQCDLVINPKPVVDDLRAMKPGSTLWGWPHCVQGRAMAQAAIDRRLTLIAWEAMFTWSGDGQKQMHIFYKNNEMAGYCGVLDALRLAGLDGHYGQQKDVVVLSLGSVSRGAIIALQGRGFHRIQVYTSRPPHIVRDQVPGLTFRRFLRNRDNQLVAERQDGKRSPFREVLAEADIIVNGTLQDTDSPTMFVEPGEVDLLKRDGLIIDISCDEGMGFPFARPTTVENPTFTVGRNLTYYAVDHTPTYLWNAASWEISKGLIPYLDVVAAGPEGWARDETIKRAIEIHEGVIQNPKILRFQDRESSFPHALRA